jgi:tRNA pseudouridine55 synthase
MTGVLNLYKPAGPTSHDIVAQVRRLLGVRRVGHAGTLDPMARGVLVVCVGNATRIIEYFADLPKQYVAQMTFGIETDSQDTTGMIQAERDATHLRAEDLVAVLDRFRGPIMQTPPMVSAVKHEGRRLYELARAGHEVERKARPVTIYELKTGAFQPGPRPTATLAVTCSGGTYVRTLCADIGTAAGVGAAMSDLERTAVGPFRGEDALSLEALAELAAEGRVNEVLIPPARALEHLPAVVVDEADRVALAQGRRVGLTPPPCPPPRSGEGGGTTPQAAGEDATPSAPPLRFGEGAGGGVKSPLRVLTPDGDLVAIARVQSRDGQPVLAPEKVFVSAP